MDKILKTTATMAITLLAIAQTLTANEFVSWVWKPQKVAWRNVTEVGRTPKEICELVRYHVKYLDDKDDTWQGAARTWVKGTGDCEDFAFTIQHLCRKLGYEATIRAYYDERTCKGHAVVIGKWAGRSWLSSNGGFEWVTSEDAIHELNASILGIGKNDIASLKWYDVESEKGPVIEPFEPIHDVQLSSKMSSEDAPGASSLPAYNFYYNVPYADIPE